MVFIHHLLKTGIYNQPSLPAIVAADSLNMKVVI